MLAAVVQGGRALAWSLANDDVVFRETYPGYPSLAAVGPPPPAGTYASRYAIWAQTSLDTTQGILRGAGFQGKLLATEQGVLGILRGLSAANLLNRNDAINLTGQLAAEQVAQLQKLRELQLEDMTSKGAYQGYQVQKDADMVATEQQFFGPTVINPGDSRVFPTTP
jgi:P-type conjugative transfer protein TrbJ